MAMFDYSHLGLGPGGGSYRESLNDVGDALTEVMKRRAAQQHADAVQAQHRADQERLSSQFAITNARETASARATADNQRAMRERDDKRFSAEGQGKVREAFVKEGPEGATAAGAPYGINVAEVPRNPGEAPEAPTPPVAPDRAEIPAIGPTAFLPPEFRAMLGRANQQASAVPEPEKAAPPPGGATEPPAFEAGAAPSQGAKPPDLADQEMRIASFPGEQRAAAQRGYSAQGEQEQRYADQMAAFPGQQHDFDVQQAVYRRRMAAPPEYEVTLPGGAPGGRLSRQTMVQAPRQREADDFRQAQLAQLDQQEQQARQLMTAGGPPEVRARRQAAANQILSDVASQRQHVERIAASVGAGAETGQGAGRAYESALAEGRKSGEKGTYSLTADEQIRQRELDRASRERAARAAGDRGDRGVGVKELTQYETAVQNAKKTALEKVDVAGAHDAARLATMLKNPNGTEGQFALDNLARAAMGGRGTNLVIQRAWQAMPYTQRLENQISLQTTGHHSQAVLRDFRKIVADQALAADDQAKRTLHGLDVSIGLRSAYARDPAMVPQIKAKMRGAYEELGQPIPPEYQDDVTIPAAGGGRPAPRGGAHPADAFLDSLGGE